MSLEDLMFSAIEVTAEEAMLIDWVFTMHGFDETLLNWLMLPDIKGLREKAGEIIVKGDGRINFSDDDLKILLVLIPITHRWGEIDVGYSLKKKLYKAYLGIGDNTESKTEDKAEDITISEA